MSINLEKLKQNKDRILSLINMRGPSLPVQIARAIGLEPLFASAFLSELYAEGRIKLSNLRVGSSPLYYIPGQEQMLEKFMEYLNQREKEAFQILKKENLLEDEKLSPVIRVALRTIKDFAIPVRIRIKDNPKLFWKYFLVQDSELEPLILNLYPKPKEPTQQIPQQRQESHQNQDIPVQEPQQPLHQQIPKQRKRIKQDKEAFLNKIKENLKNKNIDLLEVLEYNNKEIMAKIKDKTKDKESILFVINKKRPDEKTIKKAYKKSTPYNLPYAIMTKSESSKSLKEKKDMYSNLQSLDFFE